MLAAGAAALAVAGCSFQGSVSAASTGSHTPRSGTGTTGTGATGTPGTATSSGSGHGVSPTPPAGSTGTGSPSTSGTDGQANRPGRCHTADLSASLVPGSPGAGQRYATIVLTNTSSATCNVYGYGGVGLVDASGAPLPTQQVRVSPPGPTLVTLQPHQSARSQLHWSAVPGAGDSPSGQCQPTPAALRIIPPDETTHLSVPWNQGPVCEQGTIHQQAYTG